MDDSDVANTLWGLWRLRAPVPEPLMGRLLQRTRDVLPGSKPNRFTTMLWCLAVQKVEPDEALQSSILTYVRRHYHTFHPQQVLTSAPGTHSGGGGLTLCVVGR